MNDKTYIIGHKNPDADAICSAIGYAALKHAIGKTDCIPARCGNSNDRIDTILRKFNQPLPLFLGDVTPRVRDIMISDVFKVKSTNTCAEALEIIDQHDVRVLPVIDENDTIRGVVSVFKLGEYFIPKPGDSKFMRHVYTSVNDIIRSLKATVLSVCDEDKLEDLYVRVGAMDITTFGNFTHQESIPAEQSIIVVGNRYDIQNKSIHAGVRLLVVTGGLQVEEEIITLAKQKNICVIVSPYDSASTSWIIRTASRVNHMLDENIVSFNAEDKLNVVRRKVTQKYAPAYMVVDENNKLEGIFSRSDIIKSSQTKLILVDHNEISQAVNGAEQVQITEIIDHHRLGNIPTQQPILFTNEPVGSTCTIVTDMFRREQKKPSKEIAGILMSGIISDTLNLNSPTSTEKDAYLLEWLSEIAGVSANELAEVIFTSGSVVINNSPEEIIRSDLKIYTHGNLSYSVSQVEELGFNNFWKRHNDLYEALQNVNKSEELFFSALLITDINTQNSMLMVVGSEEIIEQITYPRTNMGENIFELHGIVSRKKQLIPYLTSLLNNTGVSV